MEYSTHSATLVAWSPMRSRYLATIKRSMHCSPRLASLAIIPDVYERQAYARADFHQRFMRGRITLIGCPKLDEGDYTEKLTEIIRRNDIREVTVVRMEVPCCGGIQRAVETALRQSGKFIPWQVVTLGRDGNILD